MQFQILCLNFPISSSLIRRKGHNREIQWLAVTSHVCNFTIQAIPLVSTSMRKNMMRAIWKPILVLVKSRKVCSDPWKKSGREQIRKRERAASGWAGLSCDARQQLGERMRTSAMSACAPLLGREIQRTRCACSAARIWRTHTRVPLCTPCLNATFIKCLNFH